MTLDADYASETEELTDPNIDDGDEPADFDQVDDLPNRDDRQENWHKLRRNRDQWKARAEASEEQAHRGLLWEAGFDPGSGQGKALLKAIANGEVELTADALVEHAGSEYGFVPSVRFYSVAEVTQIGGGQRQQDLSQLSTSDTPLDINQQIAEAEAAGNHQLARQLKNRLVQNS